MTFGLASVTAVILLSQSNTDTRGVVDRIHNSAGMVLRSVPAGTFTMGAPASEPHRRADERSRQVTLTRPFLISETEVTQQQWVAVMKTVPWRGKRSVKAGPGYPVAYVNWNDAVAFCRKLSRMENRVYRLPAEAEWEWACRAGTQTVYSFGDSALNLSRHAFYRANTIERGVSHAQPVAHHRANAYGLFDMHGNQWEWCADWYTPHPVVTVDPRGPARGVRRVIRGGSWHCSADLCRAATRFYRDPAIATSDVGFRVVLELPPTGGASD